MLDRYERHILREIEWQISAADPDFASVLRGGQRMLPRAAARAGPRLVVAMLVLLVGALLVLGLPTSALAVVALAAALWWLRRFQITHQEL